MPYVITANMHMSYNEEELDTEKKAEEIDYKGSLKKKY
jgi:nitrate reductase NapD